MNPLTANRIIEAQEKAMLDCRYQKTLSDFRVSERKLLQLLSSLPQDQQNIIMGYCGAFYELHLYLLEFACQE